MNRVLFFMAACLIFSLPSCNSPKEKSNADQDSSQQLSNKESQEVDLSPAPPDSTTVYLEGLYATSTMMPEKGSDIEKIFDKDESTYWSTMKGAGPDEGFMLYFKDELFIKEISLLQVAKTGFADIQLVSTYVNGSSHSTDHIREIIGINKKVKSLFVRIKQVKNNTLFNSKSEPSVSIASFDENLSAGISEIEIKGENDIIYTIVPPKKVDGSVVASSVLNPQTAYHPIQLFDSRKEFVFAEGAPGAGENETLTFKFDQKVKMDGLKIWNGFQRSDKHYSANARIKSFEFGTPGNTSKYTLKDEQAPQDITLTKGIEGNEFVLKILEVYPGTSYKDLVLSELRFLNQDVSFVIRNKEEEKNIQALEEKAKGTVLEKVLDRRIKNSIEEYSSSENSLILRSDYTFVLYENDNSDNDKREIIGDGSWEIVDLQKDKAKIRVFGKLLDLSQTFNEYQGSSSSSYLRIFQDFVTIDNTTVKGEKFVRTFLMDQGEENK